MFICKYDKIVLVLEVTLKSKYLKCIVFQLKFNLGWDCSKFVLNKSELLESCLYGTMGKIETFLPSEVLVILFLE